MLGAVHTVLLMAVGTALGMWLYEKLAGGTTSND